MKLSNIKQLAYSQRKVEASQRKRERQLRYSMFGIMLLILGLFAFSNPDISKDDALDVGVQTATVMGTVGSIDSVSNKERTGKQVKSKMWIISTDQIDDSVSFPSLVDRTRGNITLKSGEYWHYIEAVTDSPEPKWTGEEGDVASPLNMELPFVIGGMDNAVFNLLEEGVGEEFIVVWEICSTGDIYGGGNGCKGLKLSSFDGGSTKDSTSTTVIFKGQCGELWYKYSGNTPTEDPDTIAADTTEITLTDNSQYQLTTGSTEAVSITGFSAVADSDISRVVTVLGSGGDYPSIIESGNDFILDEGETWTAESGSQITFKIYKDGTDSYKFIEVSGSRS
jgi:hypothetical protein